MKDLFGEDISEEDSLPKKKRNLREKTAVEGRLWTRNKADLIDCYINRKFLFVAKRGVYIDAFAGHQYEEQQDSWAAKLLWQNNAGRKSFRIERFELFELNPNSYKSLTQMCKSINEDGRNLGLHNGDSNILVPQMLKQNPIKSKMPTFCLLDQRNRECEWELVKKLAKHKGQNEGTKIELFYFLASGWISRSIKTVKVNRNERLQKWWGRSDYDLFAKATIFRQCEIICKRFKEELGYKYVAPFPIYSEAKGGKILYHMIHCSDHPRAIPLMESAYREVIGRNIPQTKEEAFEWDDSSLTANLSSIENWKKFEITE